MGLQEALQASWVRPRRELTAKAAKGGVLLGGKLTGPLPPRASLRARARPRRTRLSTQILGPEGANSCPHAHGYTASPFSKGL